MTKSLLYRSVCTVYHPRFSLDISKKPIQSTCTRMKMMMKKSRREAMIINSNNPLVQNSAAIDLEWIPFEGEYSHDKTRITSAAFCTNRGKRIVLHISRFKQYPNPERKLIKNIIYNLNRLNITFGWYSTGVRKFNRKKQKCEEHKNRYINTIIFAKKNRYVAWTGKSSHKPILKNLDGMSGRYPKWIKQNVAKIATYIITTEDHRSIESLICKAFHELESGKVSHDDLAFVAKLSKDPEEYKNENDRMRVLARMLEAHKGDTVRWYETLPRSSNKSTYSIKPDNLNLEIQEDFIE